MLKGRQPLISIQTWELVWGQRCLRNYCGESIPLSFAPLALPNHLVNGGLLRTTGEHKLILALEGK